MNYNIESLIDKLKYEFSDFYIAFKDYEFEYDDCIAVVTGHIEEDWDYVEGDYWTPPTAYFRSRFAEIEEASLIYEDGRYDLTTEELMYIEKQLQRE